MSILGVAQLEELSTARRLTLDLLLRFDFYLRRALAGRKIVTGPTKYFF